MKDKGSKVGSGPTEIIKKIKILITYYQVTIDSTKLLSR